MVGYITANVNAKKNAEDVQIGCDFDGNGYFEFNLTVSVRAIFVIRALYNAMLDVLPHRELTCGFLSGKEEILNWEPSDLFQFYYDTTPIMGALDELRGAIDEHAVNKAIKTGVCNVFHACV